MSIKFKNLPEQEYPPVEIVDTKDIKKVSAYEFKGQLFSSIEEVSREKARYDLVELLERVFYNGISPTCLAEELEDNRDKLLEIFSRL